MNIGLNCFNINPNYGGGINTYTLGLLGGFAEKGKSHKFQLYVKNTNSHLFESFSNYKHFEIIMLPEISKAKYYLRGLALLSGRKFYKKVTDSIYNYVIEAEESGSDIIYTPTTILFPVGFHKPTIISMHDIQQFHYPEFFSKAELLNRKIHYSLSADYAAYIQASSTFIKEDLLKHYNNLKEEQIIVIPEGVNIETFSSKKDTGFLSKKYNIPEDFIFFPAQLWHHKNHITVLKALKKLKELYHLEIPIVMTGSKASAADTIFSYIKENNLSNVHYLGLIPYPDLLALYQKGKFLITAVLYESSSLPLLEAAASGTPLIASATPPNIEMGKILKINTFSPQNDNELAELLNNIWNNNELIRDQTEYNSKNVCYYSWNNAAERYLNFIESKFNVK